MAITVIAGGAGVAYGTSRYGVGGYGNAVTSIYPGSQATPSAVPLQNGATFLEADARDLAVGVLNPDQLSTVGGAQATITS